MHKVFGNHNVHNTLDASTIQPFRADIRSRLERPFRSRPRQLSRPFTVKFPAFAYGNFANSATVCFSVSFQGGPLLWYVRSALRTFGLPWLRMPRYVGYALKNRSASHPVHLPPLHLFIVTDKVHAKYSCFSTSWGFPAQLVRLAFKAATIYATGVLQDDIYSLRSGIVYFFNLFLCARNLRPRCAVAICRLYPYCC